MKKIFAILAIVGLWATPGQAKAAGLETFFAELFGGDAYQAQPAQSGRYRHHAYEGQRGHRAVGSGHAQQNGSFTALASWYGAELAGRRTASGEVFRPGGLTVAHRSLPLGTRLLLSHQGRSVVVRVTDRGPAAWTGRSLDVSRGAAARLGLIAHGTGHVNVTVLASR